MRVRWWVVALVAVTSGVTTSTAGAAGWVTLAGPSSAASGVAATPTALAVDGSGDLWLAFADSSSGAGTAIEVLERAPGGSFVSSLDLPQSGAHPPVVAAGSDGTVAVAWTTGSTQTGIPHVAIRAPGGTFGTPLNGATGAETALTGLAVLPGGTVVLAWQDDTAPYLHAASVAAGGPLVDETPTGISGIPSDSRFVANSAGEAVLSWTDSPAANKTRIAFSERPPGGAFGPTKAIESRTLQGGESSQGDMLRGLALDDAGDLAAASNLLVDASGTTTDTLQAHVRPAGQASFTHTILDSRDVTAFGSSVFAPALVLDASRTATVVWANSAEKLVAASTTSGGTAFSAPASFTAATPGRCAGDDVAPIIAPLAGGGLAGLISSEAFPPLCFGAPLVPLSPAGGTAVTAQPAIAPVGAWAVRLVPDSAGDAFAPVSFSPDQASVPVIAYDATPPTIGAIAVPASVAAGSPASLSVSAADAISSVSVSWSFGDGASASGAGVSHTWAAPGAYTVTATATDGAGNSTATSTRVVVADRTAPVIGGASLTHRSFAVGPGRTAISARKHKPPRGTTIRFTLSELAGVKLTITHQIAGRRVGKRCVAARGRGMAHKRCKVSKSDGTLTRGALAAGPNRVPFSGRIGRRRLKAGAYQLRIDATDAAGNRAIGRTLRFKIVKT